MRRAVIWIMFLNLLRDRGTLLSNFFLPAIVYVIFASIFSGTTGGNIDVKVAISDQISSERSARYVEKILEVSSLNSVSNKALSQSDVERLVKSGDADVGLIISSLPSAKGVDAKVSLITDPSRAISVSILEGAVQTAFGAVFPEAPVRSIADLIDQKISPLNPEQKARIDAAVRSIADPSDDGVSLSVSSGVETTTESVSDKQNIASGVIYYAGGVAILFLLFSSVNGAMSILDEREHGLFDRLSVGPGGSGILVDGRFVFLIAQGFVQVALIFIVAWLFFLVDLPSHFGPWLLVTFFSCLAASGLALAFVLACQNRTQAQTIANIVILIISAVGGSMVPRFLMPDWIQNIGWLTPNTWALEAYSSIFWRGEPIEAIIVPCVVLCAAGLIGLGVARVLAARS